MKRPQIYLVLAIGTLLALQTSAALAGKGGGDGGGGPKPSAPRSVSMAKPAAKPAMKAIKPAQGLKPAGGIAPGAGNLRSVVKGPNIVAGNSQLSNAAKIIANPAAPRNLAGNVGGLLGDSPINPGAVAGNPGNTGRGIAKPGSPIRTIGNPGNGSGSPTTGNGGNPTPGNGGTNGGNPNNPGTPGSGGGNPGAVPPGQIVDNDGATGVLEPAPGGGTGRNPSPDDPFDLPGAGDGLNPDDLFPMQPLPDPPFTMQPPDGPPLGPPLGPPDRLYPPARPPVLGGIGISFPVFGGGTSVATTVVVAQPAVQPVTVDLELLEVRQLDLGDGATMGPAYRITIRNRSHVNVSNMFDVTILGSLSRQLASDSPHASTTVRGIRSGETLAIDVRLPIQALSLGRNAAGASVPFTWLTAAIDVAGQIAETNLENNLVTMNRAEIAMAQ